MNVTIQVETGLLLCGVAPKREELRPTQLLPVAAFDVFEFFGVVVNMLRGYVPQFIDRTFGGIARACRSTGACAPVFVCRG